MSYQLAEHGLLFGQQPERISLGALPEQNEVMMLQNGIAAAVRWVVGADSCGRKTLAARVRPIRFLQNP